MDISNVINDDGFDCRDVLLLLDKVQGNKIFWQDVFDSFMSFMRKLNQKLVTVKYILIFHYGLFVCLFVCLFGVFSPNREFITHMETSPNFDLCSALMAIEQLGFFSLSRLLRHGARGFV